MDPIISNLSDTHKRAEQFLVFQGLIAGTRRSRAKPNQSIITKKWEGWQDETASDTIKNLAKLTKGYGGADLRVSRALFPNLFD